MARRLPTGRQAPAQSATPRSADIGDNSLHGEEAERVTLLSFVSKLNVQIAEAERLKAPYDAAKKAINTTFKLANAAGLPRKLLERRMEEMNFTTINMAEEAAREAKHRRWLGILEPEQAEMMLGTSAPQEAKDEVHWRAEGYKDGLRMKAREAPKECSPRFLQAYQEGHEKGFGEATLANAPKPMPLTVAEQAKADFEADQREFDEAAAARRLKNDPDFMDRSAPEDEDHIQDEVV